MHISCILSCHFLLFRFHRQQRRKRKTANLAVSRCCSRFRHLRSGMCAEESRNSQTFKGSRRKMNSRSSSDSSYPLNHVSLGSVCIRGGCFSISKASQTPPTSLADPPVCAIATSSVTLSSVTILAAEKRRNRHDYQIKELRQEAAKEKSIHIRRHQLEIQELRRPGMKRRKERNQVPKISIPDANIFTSHRHFVAVVTAPGYLVIFLVEAFNQPPN